MIEFELRKEAGISSWWDVTVGMAPDGIHYTIYTDDSVIKRRGPLPPLVSLFVCVRGKRPSNRFEGEAPFSLAESADGVELRDWSFDEPIVTTYIDLLEALQPFLTEVVATLDEKGETSDRRRESFEFVSSYAQINFPNLYEELKAPPDK